MKIILKYITGILLALFLFSCSDILTDVQTKSFVKFYGSYQVDIGEEVHVLSDGGYAVVGTLLPDSIEKMVLILTDEYGNQKLHSPHCFGGDSNFGARGKSLIALDDGYLLAGEIIDTIIGVEVFTDIFLVKLRSDGTEDWSATYGGSGIETVSHVIERSGGGYVIAGKMNEGGHDNIWVIMIDESGKLISELKGNNVTSDDEANFIYNTGAGYLVACTYVESSDQGKDLMALYVDENCNIIDVRSVGTEYNDLARGIVTFNNEFILFGYALNTSTGYNQIELYSFSLEENLIRNQESFATIEQSVVDSITEEEIIPKYMDVTVEACVVNSNGELALVGTMEVNENRDILMLLVDEEGKLVPDEDGKTFTSFGDLGAQSGSSIQKTLEGGLVITGSNSLDGNSVIALVKTDARGKF